ncbi:hypothetical protein [Streptomyces sp. NRRL F-5135]|uniref:hypothetical protein n=1 Tax=Streptomyces sp. NRRL F-5135 TaxID=1463858 RepID=UPI0004C793A9|nr:hypothetical protein [Streptomyces sp. NRRL F-5135]
MTKKRPSEKTLVARQLRRAGATDEQITAHELAVLREVMDHAGVGGNASDYVLDRIENLTGGAS